MTAIETKYLPPTDTKGARIKATALVSGRSVIINYPHEATSSDAPWWGKWISDPVGVNAAHRMAFEALLRRYPDIGTRSGEQLPVVCSDTKRGFLFTFCA